MDIHETKLEMRYILKVGNKCKHYEKKKLQRVAKELKDLPINRAGIWQSKEYAMDDIIHSLLLKENKLSTIHDFKRVKFTVLIEAEIQQYLKRHWGARVWLQSISWSYLTRTVKNSWYYTNTKNSNVSLKRP